jgi:hypothetical protein
MARKCSYENLFTHCERRDGVQFVPFLKSRKESSEKLGSFRALPSAPPAEYKAE